MEVRALQQGASASISWPLRLSYESVYKWGKEGPCVCFGSLHESRSL